MLGKKLTVAILDGAGEVIQPLTVATLAICIVFFPVVMLFGVARFLFIPLAATVVFCMLASYALSFTVVPSFARLILASDTTHHAAPKGFFGLFDRGFERFRRGYGWMLEGTLRNRGFVLVLFVALLAVTGVVASTIGLDFFPSADVGLIKLHYRAPAGTRIEDTEKLVLKVEDAVRKIIPDSGTGHHQRLRRRAVVVQPGVRADRQRRRHGCGDLDLAEERSSPDDRLHPRDPGEAAASVPRQRVLLPDRRYRQPGAELRLAGADRRADPGCGFQPFLWAGAATRAADEGHPGGRRRACRAGAELSRAADRRGPAARLQAAGFAA